MRVQTLRAGRVAGSLSSDRDEAGVWVVRAKEGEPRGRGVVNRLDTRDEVAEPMPAFACLPQVSLIRPAKQVPDPLLHDIRDG